MNLARAHSPLRLPQSPSQLQPSRSICPVFQRMSYLHCDPFRLLERNEYLGPSGSGRHKLLVCICQCLPIHPDLNSSYAGASSAQPKDTRTTVEEVEDEDDVDADTTSASKKKKKKKPKKKKTDSDLPVLPEDAPASPVVSAARVASPPSSPSKASPARRTSLNSSATTLLNNMSTTSLPLTEQTTAHSGHSFLQEITQKEKIKSRPDHASMFNRGFLSKGKEKAKEKDEGKDTANNKHTWFSKLGKKTTGYMHQLLRAGDDERRGAMKWESFLKVLRFHFGIDSEDVHACPQVMRDMGFSYDPSTAGSSVRFDPPHDGDRVCYSVY